MTETGQMLSAVQKQALSDLVHRRFGLFFPVERHADLLRAVVQAAEEANFADTARYVDWVLSSDLSDKQLEPLVTSLTVGETYFFRDDALFRGLRERIFPEIVRRDRRNQSVRVWSAGCSTGEEPYSLAMLLDYCGIFSPQWAVELHATDVNVKSLRKARQGKYSRWSFRGVLPEMQQRYFEAIDDHHWQLCSRIRHQVHFSYLNLAREPYCVGDSRAPFDVILCRNVLMYFSGEVRNQILSQLSHMLVDGGWLIVSPSESGLVEVPSLLPVNVDGMVMHQKTTGTAQVAPFSPPPMRGVQPPRRQRKVDAPSVRPVAEAQRGAKKKPAAMTRPAEEGKPVLAPAQGLEAIRQQVARGGYAQAIDALTQRQAAGGMSRTDQVENLLLLARCHANLGEPEQAEEWVQQAVQLDRLNASAQYLLAGIQLECHDLNAARQSLERALYLDDDYIMAHFTMGMLLAQLGEKQQGQKNLQRVTHLLSRLDDEALIPDSEGMTVAHLRNTLMRFV